MKDYKDAAAFNRLKYERIEVDEISVTVIGDITLSEEELAVLKLHPKFSIRGEVTHEKLNFEQELGYAKVRIDLRKENEEKLEDETSFKTNKEQTFGDLVTDNKNEKAGPKAMRDCEELAEEIAAKSRQFFDPEERVYDYRKKRATDVKQNTRVVLPQPVTEIQEAGIAMRRENFNKITKRWIEEKCDEKNRQKSNLTKAERAGLKSLKKRIDEEEIVVMSTDKRKPLFCLRNCLK